MKKIMAVLLLLLLFLVLLGCKNKVSKEKGQELNESEVSHVSSGIQEIEKDLEEPELANLEKYLDAI